MANAHDNEMLNSEKPTRINNELEPHNDKRLNAENATLDELELDNELCNLFDAFDEVCASDELQEATLARIFAEVPAMADNCFDNQAPEEPACDGSSPSAQIKVIAGGKPKSSTKKAKRRTFRVAAVAACLALSLGGGVAYAAPATYYEIEQGDARVTLGVNLFGITVSATADNDMARELVESSNLTNIPYEQSIARTIEQMQASNPDEPIEYGPRDGAHELAPTPYGNDAEPQGQAMPNEGNAGESFAGGTPAGSDAADGYGAGGSGESADTGERYAESDRGNVDSERGNGEHASGDFRESFG